MFAISVFGSGYAPEVLEQRNFGRALLLDFAVALISAVGGCLAFSSQQDIHSQNPVALVRKTLICGVGLGVAVTILAVDSVIGVREFRTLAEQAAEKRQVEEQLQALEARATAQERTNREFVIAITALQGASETLEVKLEDFRTEYATLIDMDVFKGKVRKDIALFSKRLTGLDTILDAGLLRLEHFDITLKETLLRLAVLEERHQDLTELPMSVNTLRSELYAQDNDIQATFEEMKGRLTKLREELLQLEWQLQENRLLTEQEVLQLKPRPLDRVRALDLCRLSPLTPQSIRDSEAAALRRREEGTPTPPDSPGSSLHALRRSSSCHSFSTPPVLRRRAGETVVT